MSYFRKYDLLTQNPTLTGDHSPGRYRRLTDDEVCLEWARTRERLSKSPPASPPSEHTQSTGMIEDGLLSFKPKTKRVALTESLLRKLKESNVDASDDDDNEFDESANVYENDYSRDGDRLQPLAIDPELSKSQRELKSPWDEMNTTRGVKEIDHCELFQKIAKRRIIKFHTPKKDFLPKDKHNGGRQTKQTEFILITSDRYSLEGMEQATTDNNHQSAKQTDDRTVQQTSLETVGSCSPRFTNKLSSATVTNHGQKSPSKMSSPKKGKTMDTSVESEQQFPEQEICNSSNVSRRSAGSLSDDDTLQSISSDEVNVYLDEHGNRLNSSRHSKSPQNARKNKRTKFGNTSNEVSPRTSSGAGGDLTPDDAGSFSTSSPDVSTRSQEDIVIPKIRIISESGNTINAENSYMSDHGLAGSRDVSIDSLEGAITGTRRSQRSSIDSGTGSDPVRQVHNHFVVAAIDFGTAYSGYAFSFSREKEKIYMMRKWEGGDPGVSNQKTLTTILLTPDEKFHSFGFTARDTFHNLKPQESKKWHYFEKFKMVLHYSTELNKETSLRSSSGKLIPALSIFTFALEFFKNHALQELSDMTGTPILTEDIRWVITVPAIWRAQAKQFMRQAAYQAGIGSENSPDQLLIALEPEAASVCCRKLRMHQVIPEPSNQKPLTSPRKSTIEPPNLEHVLPDKHEDDHLPLNESAPEAVPLTGYRTLLSMDADLMKGTRYMVVDCGGGTVDITVHEIQDNEGRLKELYKATGGPYGSVGVDIEFENLLCAIFGTEFIHLFQQKRPAGWDDLMIAFESRKRSAVPDKPNPLNVSLPFSFIDLYRKTKSGQIESAIRKFGDSNIRWSSQGMLRLNPEAMRKLFLPTVNRIKQTVGDIINHPDARGLTYMFLVGGFAESRILQSEIRREFGHLLRVIIPQGVSLAILEGAVLFGWDPSVVNIRKSRLTYGIGVLNRFDPDKHPDDKRVSKNGVDWCADVFQSFVKVNQSIALGDVVTRSYTPARPGQRTSIINIFCSERSDIQFVTDNDVRCCGTLCLDLSAYEYQPIPARREIQTKMFFGDTEIKVTALDVASGTYVRAGIDFLSK